MTAPAEAPPIDPVRPAGIAAEVLLARLGGDEALLRELVGIFLTDLPQRLGALRAALARGDAPGAGAAARRLRGSLGLFATAEVTGLAARIEESGRSGDLAGARAALVRLEAHGDRLADELNRIGRPGSTCAS